ncbi:MAG: 4Fe-4S dicluster domain-containing protein [Oscillospiraceae bacterium]|jgi:dissimilatory sulfite reductase (desulfoviridin) alpha/beta subunit|nr:4Fe-4S dicluster domain-containing protein [Oscillospiraceae bacterium]
MATLTVKPEDEKRVKALGFLSNKGTDNFSARIITVNGVLTADQIKCIADAAERFGSGRLCLTTRLTLEVQGIPYDKIDEFIAVLAKEGLVTGGTGPKVRPVVSCKGTTCQYGLIDTYALSQKIHDRFYNGYHQVKLPHKFKIAVGGCPNNCVKPDLNDLGIIGQKIPNFDQDSCNGCRKCTVEAACPMGAAKVEDGVLNIDPKLCNNCGRCIGKCNFDAINGGTQGYKIYIGGRWGKKVARGKALSKVISSQEEALDVIEKAILLYHEKGNSGERFAQMVERCGLDEIEKELFSDDIMNRKQEILDESLHGTGGATC